MHSQMHHLPPTPTARRGWEKRDFRLGIGPRCHQLLSADDCTSSIMYKCLLSNVKSGAISHRISTRVLAGLCRDSK